MNPFEGVVSPPEPGALSVYMLGPGIGESVVLIFPDARCVVIDACGGCGRESLTLDLLKAIGAAQVDLLIWTHPDLDHYSGMSALLDDGRVRQMRKFPTFALLREVLDGWRRRRTAGGAGHGDDERLAGLHDLMGRVEALEDENRAQDIEFGYGIWPPEEGGAYTLHCIAPMRHDLVRAKRFWKDLVIWEHDRPVLNPTVVRYLCKRDGAVGDRPNGVSIAMSLEWGIERVLLTGDVERGDGTAHSGWSGVLARLNAETRGHLVLNPRILKVAHHGSPGAWDDTAWAAHSDGAIVELAMIAPFSSHKLPTDEVLSERVLPAGADRLRRHARQLALTASGGDAFARAVAAGWIATQSPRTGAGCIRITLTNVGTLEVGTFGDASLLVHA